jgi:hypothetical protein
LKKYRLGLEFLILKGWIRDPETNVPHHRQEGPRLPLLWRRW